MGHHHRLHHHHHHHHHHHYPLLFLFLLFLFLYYHHFQVSFHCHLPFLCFSFLLFHLLLFLLSSFSPLLPLHSLHPPLQIHIETIHFPLFSPLQINVHSMFLKTHHELSH